MKTAALASLLVLCANLALVAPASAQHAAASRRPSALSIEIVSPSNEFVTASATVEVVAAIGGAADQVTEATCNGREVFVLRGQVRCEVQLLPGRNAVVVHVRHASGGQASAGISVTRLKTPSGPLLISPQAITVGVSENRFIGAIDENGQRPHVWWTSSDAAIAELRCTMPQPACVLHARAAGSVTITAAYGSRSASTRVTVSPAPSPAGAIAGQVALIDGLVAHDIVHTHQVATETPYAHVVLVNQEREVSLEGVEILGTPHSIDRPHAQVPAEGWRIMGDDFGGVVMVDGVDRPTALVRAAGPVNSRPWRYHSLGRIEDIAQDYDGVIYVAETADDGLAAWIVLLDGQTGLERARLTIPASDRVEPARCGVPERRRALGVLAWTAPVIDGASAAMAIVERHERVRVESCAADGVDFTETLWLLRITPEGAAKSQPMHTVSGRMSAGRSGAALSIGGVIPDPDGGVLTIWKATSEASPSTWQITRVASSQVTTYALPLADPDFDNVMMTDEGLIIQSVAENRVLNVDPIKGTLRWAASTSGELLGVKGTGGIVLRTARGTVEYLDGAGRISPLDVDGGAGATALRLIDEKLVVLRGMIAEWPFFAGVGRALPLR